MMGVYSAKIADLQRDRLVGVKPRLDEYQIGAFSLGGDRRHRGMNPELPRFIACRCDDAAFARSSDRNRLAAQLGIIALFHRCVERIHVDMDDFAEAARPERGLFRARFGFHASPSPHRWPGEHTVRVNRVLQNR